MLNLFCVIWDHTYIQVGQSTSICLIKLLLTSGWNIPSIRTELFTRFSLFYKWDISEYLEQHFYHIFFKAGYLGFFIIKSPVRPWCNYISYAHPESWIALCPGQRLVWEKLTLHYRKSSKEPGLWKKEEGWATTTLCNRREMMFNDLLNKLKIEQFNLFQQNKSTFVLLHQMYTVQQIFLHIGIRGLRGHPMQRGLADLGLFSPQFLIETWDLWDPPKNHLCKSSFLV